MHKLYTLNDKLVKELENYADGNLDTGSLSIIDTLAHAAKNICKVIESRDEEYSGYEGESYNDAYSGRMVRRAYPMRSYRRGRDAMGRYTSRSSGMVEELRGLMDSAPDEDTRRELSRLISKMEQA